MKVFTKEYFDLISKRFLSEDLEYIEDHQISEEFINRLIEENKLQYINGMIESFEKENSSLDLLIDMIDRDNEELSVEEKQEILDNFKEDYIEDEEPKVLEIDDLSKEYDESFRNQLEHINDLYPQFLIDKVDSRLLVLNYVPKSLKVDIEAFDAETEKEVEVFENRISKHLETEVDSISPIITENLTHNLDEVTGFEVVNGKGILKISRDDFPYSDKQFNDQVIFHDCVVLENEVTFGEDFTYIIESEIYLKENGLYEVHLLFEQEEQYYLTLECSDISFRRVP